MPFRFRLQKVLEIRVRVEERRQKELREAADALQRETDKQAGYMRHHEEALQEWGTLQQKGSSAYLALLFQHFLARSRERMREQDQRIRKTKLVVDERRAAYVRARKERMALDRLKERRLFEFMKEEEVRQNRLLDELGVIAYNREDELSARH
ncbi:MAG: flagellar export protein FliJ [Nitrospirae bacterium]|nr:flagellar export protein FliJ [Nitrospirota bacterium]